jgi:D-alanyl-D-alanine carboxypeptidase
VNRLFAVLSFFCLSLPCVLLAQTDRTDTYVATQMKRRSIPGLALAVIRHGKVIKMRGYGLANVELGVRVNPDTVFQLASLSKQFTAAAILALMEAGKVGLNDPISRYLPDTPEEWKTITIKHLLTHTAGFPGSGIEYFKTLPERPNYTTAQMFKAATAEMMTFAPGEQWRYSNVGYFLLGMVIEKASGQSYRDFLADRIFKPLNMVASSVYNPSAIIKNRADTYTLRDGVLIHNRRPRFELASSGGVLSSVTDLVKWDAALESGKLLKPSSLQTMWTAVRLNSGAAYPYGFGWFVDERRGNRVISHGGSTGTEYSRYPDEKLTVIGLAILDKGPTSRG